ncbi:hypothetical protein RKD41_003780 [Streptomyces tendae]
MTVSRSAVTPNTASPSGEKPGMARPAATRSTSDVERASASARPASSRNASRERRQSPVTAMRSEEVPGAGSVTSWREPVTSNVCLSWSKAAWKRLRPTRTTLPRSSMIRTRTSPSVPSATASWITEVISFQSTGCRRERTWA